MTRCADLSYRCCCCCYKFFSTIISDPAMFAKPPIIPLYSRIIFSKLSYRSIEIKIKMHTSIIRTWGSFAGKATSTEQFSNTCTVRMHEKLIRRESTGSAFEISSHAVNIRIIDAKWDGRRFVMGITSHRQSHGLIISTNFTPRRQRTY